MSNMWLVGFGTIAATFLGPVAAVLVTRYVDHKRERYKRRLDVFRTLMRARRLLLSSDFVGALNLIDVEFYDCPQVVRAWRAYLDNLSGPSVVNEADNMRQSEARNALRANVLSEMALVLRIPIPDIDIFRGGYSPQGWVDNEADTLLGRKFLAEIAVGKRAVPVELRRPAT